MSRKTFERNWEWSGYQISKSKSGWIVKSWTRIQGQKDGKKVLVKPRPTEGLRHDLDLESEHTDLLTVGEVIALMAKESPDKILCAGKRVR